MKRDTKLKEAAKSFPSIRPDLLDRLTQTAEKLSQDPVPYPVPQERPVELRAA